MQQQIEIGNSSAALENWLPLLFEGSQTFSPILWGDRLKAERRAYV